MSRSYPLLTFAVNLQLSMNNEIIALIATAILIGSGLLFRRWYLSLPRTYKVSEQWWGTYGLSVIEHNPRFETATIEIICESKTPMAAVDDTGAEFISKKRDFTRISLSDMGIDEVAINATADNCSVSFMFEKRDFMRGIRNKEIKFFRFRFFVKLQTGTVLKSPDFAFSSKHMLFRPDSGKYN